MKQESIEKFIREVINIETENAQQAGALGYMARTLVQATLPHRDPQESNSWSRTNGYLSLVIQPAMVNDGKKLKSVGIPFGTIPRLLIAWLSTEVVRTKSKKIYLGETLTEFMKKLGLRIAGGARGDITRLKEQMTRLFSARITCSCYNQDAFALADISIADKIMLWWDPKDPTQITTGSYIELHEAFYRDIINHPVPVDLRVLKLLRQSPLAIDVHCWITHRVSYLKKPTKIPWRALQIQFGSDYSVTSQQGTRDFKRAFLRVLKKIQTIYDTVQIDVTPNNLILKPSKPHIPLLK